MATEGKMPTKALGRRVDRLGQRREAEEIGRVVIISPDTWPAEVQVAYEQACTDGDQERMADIIEAQAGERPVFSRHRGGVIRDQFPPAVIEIPGLTDGPR